MNQRLLAVAIALVAMAVTAAPTQAGFGTSPGARGQEMDHGRSARASAATLAPTVVSGRIAHARNAIRGTSNYGEWIADVERPSEGFRRPHRGR